MADRMAFYRVPGVSFAFFSSTDILWTGFTFDFSKAGEGRAVLGGGIAAVRMDLSSPD